MSRILVVGEDAICCALGESLVASVLPGWHLAGPSINTAGVTRLASRIPRYQELARHLHPVLCIGDTDGRCPVLLRSRWLAKPVPDEFLLRLAVPEAESWLLADHQGFARTFKVSPNRIPSALDQVNDPKQLLLSLVSRSTVRRYREEVLSGNDPTRRGSGYNLHLSQFVHSGWDGIRAMDRSVSLRRAVRCLEGFAGKGGGPA